MTVDELFAQLENWIAKVRVHSDVNRERGCLCSSVTRRSVAQDLENNIREWRRWAEDEGEVR